MSEPRIEWNLPLTYQREGLFLYHLLRSLRSSWYTVLLGEVAEHLLKRPLAVGMGQGRFLADLTLG
jgi:hypothetical protein